VNIAEIEASVATLVDQVTSGECSEEEFIYELLLAYGHRKTGVTLLKRGDRNIAKEPGEVIFKRHLYFKQMKRDGLHSKIDRMKKEKLVSANRVRFVIATDFDQLLAIDTKTSDSLDISFSELPQKFDFFLPWAGMEKAVYQGENPADVKAAEKMVKLFDLIKADNFDESNKDDTGALHNLNVFLTRLLFCYFAEDTEIFTQNQFSNAIKSHTKDDGSDLTQYLNQVFLVLATSDEDREALPDYLTDFPYVNGGLYDTEIPSLIFSAKSRRMLIECGSELDWSGINPDIFGSMIQAVVHPDQRGGMGMHYTSTINIMKVIEPLFLNELYEELDKVGSATKLQKFQQRLGEIKIFDPACGSGNFLIVAYKELRKLEIEVLKRLQEIELEKSGQIFQPFSVIRLSQFYGIELDDFAHEVAILSLWLAEHQMNLEFRREFGEVSPTLPLSRNDNIHQGNACRIDWADVCDITHESAVYVISNPPYAGSRYQSQVQKEDLNWVFKQKYKSLDYVCAWFYLASQYIHGCANSKFSFVSTNSICQGEQVALVWPRVLNDDKEICFAYLPFKWANNAKDKAAVIVVIIGVRNNSNSSDKQIFQQSMTATVKNINPYLADSPSVYIKRRSKPISSILPNMVYGNLINDGGFLTLSEAEKESLVSKAPEAERYVKPYIGAREFLHGQTRFCIHIEDKDIVSASRIVEISQRLGQVTAHRSSSTEKSTRALSEVPHKFYFQSYNNTPSILIPRTSSERRDYIPAGFLEKNVIIGDAQAICNAELWVFALLVSHMHMLWVKTVAGRLKSDLRYSSAICYNNYPLPRIGDKEKAELGELGVKILAAREMFPNMTLAKLYDPQKMPMELKSAHDSVDSYVDFLCQKNSFIDDEERLSSLFQLYSTMSVTQNA
jgi:hypothetical protein